MEFCWNLPVFPLGGFCEIYNRNINHSLLAENNGFDSVLVSSLPKSLDPWILATKVAEKTKKCRILVAQNTNSITPISSAKASNTLSLLSNGRIDLNIVTGSSKYEIAQETKYFNHNDRYKRTEEFMRIYREVQKNITSYEGQYYNIEKTDLFPRVKKQPRLFIAGSSDEAILAAAELGDYYITYATDFEQLKEKVQLLRSITNRNVPCGIFIDIIARESSEEAWIVAENLQNNFSSVNKKLATMYQNISDSVGILQAKSIKKSAIPLSPNLWGGLSKVSTAVSISIVGSYKEVIECLKKFQAIGIEYFLLMGSPGDNEIERIGQNIISYMK
ncbi:LLM class flavin-dependent oxidoreductase [Cytobacillus kochii]|uniref:LLM class flavin-dependent oxidoreductase n=1 Tax=Cytobacillus kochii TaxID=859143 RepID=UPI001CD7E647|nr:LLM class flavin-dependent oxidoreductase [Cytobacillus kochii]MCA1028643.1 LLM class flavin-dependent oxidoreductase [Cytobacillus kochii]